MAAVEETDGSVTVRQVRELSTTLQTIAGALPGRVHSISVRAGECSVEVIWSDGEEARSPQVERAVAPAEPAEPVPDDVLSITAPMVGTFYGRPSPDEPAFVDLGDLVEIGTQVALVEAMKMFTPVISEFRGRVVAVRGTDGDMVEFGQPLVDLLPTDE
ncbi:biotin/lipoyl-containing protein [Nonomuraea sp. NPDC003804]|uniref:acetyl-CoA carboxylase biotin carboxyl carrier protein n=1 Tax=Nonomuraea sp. NPDC003804 TaxID=3154547 RepID=UPI0033B42F2E